MVEDLGDALARAARAIDAPSSLDETLSTIAEIAKDSLPGFDAVGISTVDNHGKITTRAATSELVWELDRLQYSLRRGPSVDSLTDNWVTQAPRIAVDDRWPDTPRRRSSWG